ncbi:MAG: putative lipid II flippase FtsW [Vicinamibacteraceae bacterium]|nr:putative lipid II flippase FtsW [Vicinamibacteraceae bacterium]
MARKLRTDWLLFSATLLLVGLSVLMVYSASAVVAMEKYEQPYMFLGKQVAWAVLGLGLLAGLMRVDYRHYRDPRFIAAAIVTVVLALGLVLVMGREINGATRWFAIGGIGVQPSEAAKLVAIGFTAMWLERNMERVNDLWRGLCPILALLGVFSALIIAQPDLGTTLVLVASAGIVVFASGLHYGFVGGAAVVGAGLFTLLVAWEPYRVRRIFAFLDPWADPQGQGFQIIQSLIAVSTGGVGGRGLMAGVQKMYYLPFPHTDFIYAVVGEELGLVGTTGVLVAFAVIIWRGLSIALRAPDRFGSLLALGITAMVGLQALVNMSVVLGLLPTKGIPLPFVSSGGSSMLVSFVAMGVLLNISQHASART